MTKKILFAITLMLAFICALVSCGCEHEYGEWKPEENFTCILDHVETQTCNKCGKSNARTIKSSNHTAGEWIIVSDATCTLDGYKHQDCSVCGMLLKREIIEKTGHTTETGVCDNCGKNFSSWYHGYYVDKYQNPTDKKFIRNACKGVSDGSSVYVTVWINYNFEVYFTFSDYFKVSAYYPYDFCYDMTTIYVLDEDNQEHELSVRTYANQEDIRFTYTERDKKNQEKFKELMKNNDTLKVVIRGWDYSYSFTLDTKGITEGLDYLSN